MAIGAWYMVRAVQLIAHDASFTMVHGSQCMVNSMACTTDMRCIATQEFNYIRAVIAVVPVALHVPQAAVLPRRAAATCVKQLPKPQLFRRLTRYLAMRWKLTWPSL